MEKGTEFMSVQSKFAMASSSLSSSIHCARSTCWSVPKLTKVLLQEKSCPTTKFPSLLKNHTIPMPAQRCSLRSDYSKLKCRWFIYPQKSLFCIAPACSQSVLWVSQTPAKHDAFVALLLPCTLQFDHKGWALGGLLKLFAPAVQEVFNPPCSPFL